MDEFHPSLTPIISDVYGEVVSYKLVKLPCSSKHFHSLSQHDLFYISWAWPIAWHKVDSSAKKRRKRVEGGRKEKNRRLLIQVFPFSLLFFLPLPCPSISQSLLPGFLTHYLVLHPRDLKTVPFHLWRACYCLVKPSARGLHLCTSENQKCKWWIFRKHSNSFTAFSGLCTLFGFFFF